MTTKKAVARKLPSTQEELTYYVANLFDLRTTTTGFPEADRLEMRLSANDKEERLAIIFERENVQQLVELLHGQKSWIDVKTEN